MLCGLVAGLAIGKITEYFCSDKYKPVHKIADAADTGAATVIIEGIGTGMLSTIAPIVLVALAIIGAYTFGNMAFPNAAADGGIAASAGLSAISLFVSYQATMHHSIPDFALTLTDPLIVAGIFIGAMMPFMFAALTMGAVSRAAHAMVEEVRRQFREIKGIMEYKAEPEYDKCVAISTSSALREMMLPGCLAIVVPVAIGCFNPAMLGGFLAGAVATGSHRHLHVQRRRRVGQREEVHRAGSSWRQGLRGPQGGCRGRYRGRSVQGYLRPVHEHPHQPHDHRLFDVRPVVYHAPGDVLRASLARCA